MKRLVSAFLNSVAGLRHGVSHETAIRQELVLLLISVPVVPMLTTDPWKMLLLWASLIFILLTELLNTGIEQVANRISREFSPEIKFAKDCGSAAVLCSALIAAGVWGVVVWQLFAV